ncbi:hypothetical protein HGM15179_004566 [Zosterops borbonicus]|uniref:Uncharacterized protein n=1 Tax=Zosterops borbonicus TaxID=364589 RepID=A0A8K1GR96_9PASS|nr:hypothetical protein HGM15179_004566 [Zosterops borbonicus]
MWLDSAQAERDLGMLVTAAGHEPAVCPGGQKAKGSWPGSGMGTAMETREMSFTKRQTMGYLSSLNSLFPHVLELYLSLPEEMRVKPQSSLMTEIQIFKGPYSHPVRYLQLVPTSQLRKTSTLSKESAEHQSSQNRLGSQRQERKEVQLYPQSWTINHLLKVHFNSSALRKRQSEIDIEVSILN